MIGLLKTALNRLAPVCRTRFGIQLSLKFKPVVHEGRRLRLPKRPAGNTVRVKSRKQAAHKRLVAQTTFCSCHGGAVFVRDRGVVTRSDSSARMHPRLAMVAASDVSWNEMCRRRRFTSERQEAQGRVIGSTTAARTR